MTKQLDIIYNTVIDNSEIKFEMRGDFETYIATKNDLLEFAIGYNKKTEKYGFKRYDIVYSLYKLNNIPDTEKPNYSKLYEKTKNTYMFQVVRDNIENLDIYD